MSYESKDRMVSHPDHYQSGKYEVIDIIEEFTKDLEGIEAVDAGNAIKYVLRWHKKNGRQDLEKAIWYLTHLVQHLIDKEQAEGRHEISDSEYYKSVRAKAESETEITPVTCDTCNAKVLKDCIGCPNNEPIFEQTPERSESGTRKICGTCAYSCKYNLKDESVLCTKIGERKKHDEGHTMCWAEEKAEDSESLDDLVEVKSCANCDYGYLTTNPNYDGAYGMCTGFGFVHGDIADQCEQWERKKDIDDEPEPLHLRKNQAGVYVPEDVVKGSCINCKHEYTGSLTEPCHECIIDAFKTGNKFSKFESKENK